MKSIIQKASTIQKAVEDAWNAAGKPQEFSIRVLELPEKGFLGFTKHPAKIALVFEEQRTREPQSRQREFKDRGDQRESREPRESREQREPRESRENREGRYQQKPTRHREQQEPREAVKNMVREPLPQREQRPPAPDNRQELRSEQLHQNEAPTDQRLQAQKPQQRRIESQWSNELVVSAQKWLSEVLGTMGKGHITFTTEVQMFNLRVTLSESLTEDATKEKHLFASLSTLMMASLKREYRKALRGHKIVIAHA